MTKSKGLGDSISKITEASGIKKIVDKISEATGIDCGCSERRDKLNKLFPYGKVRQFTEDELNIYEDTIAKVQGSTIKGEQQAVLVKLYNKVFNENKKPSSCGSCVQQTLSKLKKVYQNSCKLD
jgi:hypothetical protein